MKDKIKKLKEHLKETEGDIRLIEALQRGYDEELEEEAEERGIYTGDEGELEGEKLHHQGIRWGLITAINIMENENDK